MIFSHSEKKDFSSDTNEQLMGKQGVINQLIKDIGLGTAYQQEEWLGARQS